ncbi:MAG: folylpolyglutamate synthase/dihydrofolate synthase family protein [Pelagibacteraceae bacterium]
MQPTKIQFLLNRLYQLNPPDRIELTLNRIKRLLKDLKHPEENLPNVITVTGTNGKGSVCEYLKNILKAHGHSVNVYTSPHIVKFNERIFLNDHFITDDEFEKLVYEVDAANNHQDITFFEFITALAFLAFSKHKADYHIIETGLGGIGDSTNVFSKPVAQILTSISEDHLEYLGPTLKDIVRNKCGIIKEKTNIIISKQTSEIMKYIDEELKKNTSKKIILSEDFQVSEENNNMIYQDEIGLMDLQLPKMKGKFQLENAATAIQALRSIGMKLDNNKTSHAISQTELPARIQEIIKGNLRNYVHDENRLIIDGSHNKEGGKELAGYLSKIQGKKRIYFVLGMLTSKNLKGYLENFSSLVTEIKAVKLRENFYETDEIIKVSKDLGIHANPTKNVASGLAQLALQDPESIIVVCGSLYLSGSALELNL